MESYRQQGIMHRYDIHCPARKKKTSNAHTHFPCLFGHACLSRSLYACTPLCYLLGSEQGEPMT